MSVAFIDANRQRWPVAVMCEVLGLSERTYYAAKKRTPCARVAADRVASVAIRRVWESNYRAYGARRVRLALRREGEPIARCTVERLMGEMGICGVQRGRRPRTTIADTAAPRSPDLVDRRFVAHGPDELWVTDITYIATSEGWLYLSLTCTRGRSSAGRSRRICVPNSFSTRSRWRSGGATPPVRSPVTPTRAARANSTGRRNTSR